MDCGFAVLWFFDVFYFLASWSCGSIRNLSKIDQNRSKLWFWGLFFSCFLGFFRKATENRKFYVFFNDFLNFYEFRKILKCCSHNDFQWFLVQIMFLQWIFDTFKNLPKDRKVRPKSRFWSQKYDFWESKMDNLFVTFWKFLKMENLFPAKAGA